MFLLSTPRTVPPTSGLVLKRSAKKFFEAAMAQNWTVRVRTAEHDRVVIDAWDLPGALTATASIKVRVTGTFDADSGAYHGHSYGTVEGRRIADDGTVRNRYVHGYGAGWNDKLHDALSLLETGPKYRKDAQEAAAKRKAELEAKRLRHDALRAAVLAAGESVLGKETRLRLDALSTTPEKPNLTSEYRFDEEIATWRRAKRIASHAREAKKLIHTIAVGKDGTELFLTPEEAVAAKANEILGELVRDLTPRYGLSHTDAQADAEFVREFHPTFAYKYEDVRLVR